MHGVVEGNNPSIKQLAYLLHRVDLYAWRGADDKLYVIDTPPVGSQVYVCEEHLQVFAYGHHVGDENLGVVHGSALSLGIIRVTPVDHFEGHTKEARDVLGKLGLWSKGSLCKTI